MAQIPEGRRSVTSVVAEEVPRLVFTYAKVAIPPFTVVKRFILKHLLEEKYKGIGIEIY